MGRAFGKERLGLRRYREWDEEEWVGRKENWR